MLNKDPSSRITAKGALEHPWFDKIVHKLGKGHLDNEIVENLEHYEGMSKLRMTALNVLVSMMDKKDIEPLRLLFLEIDTD